MVLVKSIQRQQMAQFPGLIRLEVSMFMSHFLSRSLSRLCVDVLQKMGATISVGVSTPKTNNLDQHRPQPSEAWGSVSGLTAVDSLETLNPYDPELWFVKLVETALRRFPDVISLGNSPLADYLGVKGETQVARGKQLQRLLQDAIESLRPDGRRPPEPLPKAWHNYVVLYDAYVEGVLNREMMARLYISEGTFNRTRRNAVRGVARLLIENSCGMR
jgi:hypothetical protein